MVRLQLPGLAEENLIAEPISRNTAPSVAWAVATIAKRNPEAVVVVTPSDQFVLNDDAFGKNVQEGLDVVGKAGAGDVEVGEGQDQRPDKGNGGDPFGGLLEA